MDRKIKGLIVLFVISLLFSTPSSFAKPVVKEKALKAAKTFLQAEKIREERKLTKIIAKQAQETINLKGFASSKIQEIRDKNGKILAYVTELKPEGFIITSADDNIRPIIGYSFKGKFPFQDSKENVLLHLAKWDIEAREKAMETDSKETKPLAQMNGDLWNKYSIAESGFLGTLSDATQWGPLINSDPNETWGQDFHYNWFCPIDPTDGIRRSKVGCVATAAAQIVKYWQYPPSISFNDNDSYFSISWQPLIDLFKVGIINIDADSNSLKFPSFDELNTALSNIKYIADPNEEAYLSFAVGIKHKMNYSYSGSGTLLSAYAYRDGFNYSSATLRSAILTLTGLYWPDYEAKAIENIKKGWPVQIAIKSFFPPLNPHSVIIDGYKSTGEFHVNCGHLGIGDWWYFLPIIDTYNTPPPQTGSYYWDVIYQIVYDICPYAAWSQYAADARNTRMIRYSGPEEHIVKWIRNTHEDDPSTRLSTAIVGSGGKVFAFSQATTALNPGKILVITPHGELYKSIEIPAPAMSISEPAQTGGSPGLPIYIAFENKVYRIRPDGVCELFYEDTNPLEDFIYPTKVDKDGNVYVTGWDKICSIDCNGVIRWSKTVPNTSSMDFSAGIAMNEDSGRVYAKYYDQDNDTAHLWALNKDTGTVIWDNPVSAIYSTMAAAGEPTIGPDGTIYVRFFKSLRAYNPDSSLEWEYNVNASQEWLEPFISIGPQGNIYICGSNFSSSPKYAWIRSLRTTDKQLLWEFQKQYPSDTSNYTFGAPIVAYDNNMIYAVFHELSSPGYRKLYALKENVGGLTEMWEHEGADCILLGSTGAVYLLDRESEKIIALSGGEVGDPEGAGMAYTNNSAPSVPSSPTPSNGEPNHDYCEPLLLSWACSDPEGHPLKYDVYLGEGEVLGLSAQNDWNDTNCVVTGLRPGTGYLWRVVATDGQAVKEGPTWAFATKPAKTDLNNDGKVNFVDFAFIANCWMDECSEPNWCNGCDLDHSGVTDMTDLSIFAGTWLKVISCNYRVINIRQLTDGVIGESGCAFNTDGAKVTYRNFHPPYSWNYCDIWTIETDGSNNTQITAAINGEFDPAFLPDGRITYSKEFGSNDYDIWMVDADGSNAHSFIGGAYRQSQSHWHTAGTKIVYANEYQWAGPSEIWTANAEGSSQTQLTNHTVDGYGQFGPIYSRSSNLIAYGNCITSSEPQHVWIMNADGSGKQQITGGTSSQSPCFWWPDDSRIGYTENGKVYLRDIANGTDQLLLEIPGATIDECDLSTDGTKLVFALSDGSEFHIWIGDVICEP